jgi:hypothetical protein
MKDLREGAEKGVGQQQPVFRAETTQQTDGLCMFLGVWNPCLDVNFRSQLIESLCSSER